MSKNWLNNRKVNSFPTNLVELIEAYVELKEELQEFEGSFKRDFIIVLFVFTLIFTSFFFFAFLVFMAFFYKICEIQVVDIQNQYLTNK